MMIDLGIEKATIYIRIYAGQLQVMQMRVDECIELNVVDHGHIFDFPPSVELSPS